MTLLMIGTSAVDPCDVALIGANGSGSLVVLADGVNLLSALAPAAQAAAVDAAEGGADPLMLTLPSASGWTGPVYVGGQQVQRIAPANGVLGSSWSLRGGPPIFALNTTVAAGLALVDATGRCGGGEPANPTAAGTAEITFDYLDNFAAPEDVYTSWTFVGEDGSDTVGVVILTIEFRNALPVAPGFAQLGATAAALPYPPDNSTVYGTVGGFDAADNESAIISSGDLYISCDADSGASNVSGAVTFQYRTGAS